MRLRRKKMIFSAVAVVTAAGVGISAVLSNVLKVQASSDMMPGIETVISNKSKEPFRILELVNKSEDAELGYYVSGQEPYIKLYEYTPTNSDGTTGTPIQFSSLEDGLSKLPSAKLRKEFAMNVKLKDDGTVDADASTGIRQIQNLAYQEKGTQKEEDYPLSYKEYQESYFLSENENADDWKQVDFSETREDTIQGHYQENSGGTGDYTKETQDYYPIREDVETDGENTQKYRENIQNFFYSDDTKATAPYQLTFEEVENNIVNDALKNDVKSIQDAYDYKNQKFGYYENVYTELTTEMTDNISNQIYMFPGEDGKMGGEETNKSEIKTKKNAGTQENPYIYRADTIDAYPYYHYTLLGDLDYVKSVAKTSDSSNVNHQDGEITIESDQYWYWSINEKGEQQKEALYLVSGRQAVSYQQVQAISDKITYPYYYQVIDYKYCCKKLASTEYPEEHPDEYEYYGWYYPSYPSNEDVYIPVESEDEHATYYISEARYTLTPGKGNYDFIPGNQKEDKEQVVQVNHLYYQGGYTNHDWLKEKVFHLSKDSEDNDIKQQFEDFQIEVDTVIVDDKTSLPDLSGYDCVYINGTLNETQATAVVTSNLPTIINQSNTDMAEIKQSFSDFIDEAATGDYVTKRVYFFGSSKTANTLVNQEFDKEFSKTASGGFEEITSYIEKENLYRETIDSTENEKTEKLSDRLSQARVLEYIINYQYRRNETAKTKLNVLDIEPCAANGDLSEETVKEWLGGYGKGTISEFCCQEDAKNEGNGNGPVSNIVDDNTSSYWHSRYSSNKHKGHYFVYQLPEGQTSVSGFYIVGRPRTSNGYANGIPFKLKIEVLDKNKTTRYSEEVELTGNYYDRQTVQLQKTVENAAYVKVTFLVTYNNPLKESKPDTQGKDETAEFAACADFGVLSPDSTSEISVTHMTSSEFVGHIDDINSKYDVIYFGDSTANRYFLRNGDGSTSLYAHVGGIFGGDEDPGNITDHRYWNTRLMGLLDIDYGTPLNGKKRLRHPQKTKLSEDLQNRVGVLRGSGNDITEQQVKQLEDFISSGYPIIIADGLLEKNKTEISTKVVDSSSYMYEFLNEAMNSGRKNVIVKSEVTKNQNLMFYFNLAKPQIEFSKLPPEPERINDTSYKYNKEADIGLLSQDEDGLEYEFTIQNDSELSSAGATYHCELFLDLNFDGNLSATEEQAEYIQIQDESGKVMNTVDGKYQLKLNTKYILKRKIPKDYYKVITWKLQISNNSNNAVRTSVMGFTKREPGEKQSLKVLQIYPQDKGSAVTWNLQTDSVFQSMLNNVEDFDISVRAINTRTYESEFRQNPDMLDDYQMLVIGFADGFGIDTISNDNGEVDAIRAFIEAGKSVIFAHDTTSFINRDSNTSDNLDPEEKLKGSWNWGYTLNTYLRASVGMDRYGITSDAAITVDGQDTTVSKILKAGNDLNADTSAFEALQESVSDMAYYFGNKQTSSMLTQGFSNIAMYDPGSITTTTATKVNEGAMTQYPYYIKDTITTATTHGQYYQLAMEEDSDKDGTNDIVVWYCLAGGGSAEQSYQYSPNDVRNNYYFYSKGNVIYTGVGHSSVTGSNNNQQERQLFVNAIVAAAQVTAVEPEAKFLENFDPTSDEESSRYYMLDRLNGNEEEAKNGNILESDMKFNLRIRDYNMVASSVNYNDDQSGKLTMELYIEDPNGEEMEISGEKVRVKKLSSQDAVNTLTEYSDGAKIRVNDKGVFALKGNDTFEFEISDIEKYVKNSDGSYRENCRIFAKITSSVTLYGKSNEKVSWASLGLKQRQLFDMN